MSTDEWIDWSTRHSLLFCLNREDDRGMLAQWRREFEAMEFTAAELHSATDFISREAKGVTRWDHLETIRDHIRQRRRSSLSAQRSTPLTGGVDRGTCDLCGNTGWAGGLPHLTQVAVDGWLPLIDGRSPITQAAVCTCLHGKWQLDAWDQQTPKYKEQYKRPMTLPQYTTLNPEWKAQVRMLSEQRLAERASDSATRDADKTGGTLNKALADVLRKLVPSKN